MPSLSILSLISSVVGAVVVLMWRVRETRRPVSAKSIIIPPLGMATGFSMFALPMFRVPWPWGIGAFLAGAIALAYPLIRTSRLVREGDAVMLQRSNVFFAVLIVLAGIRIGARSYFDHVLTVQQTAGLFFVLAFGMILRWRAQMFFEYRTRVAEVPVIDAELRGTT